MRYLRHLLLLAVLLLMTACVFNDKRPDAWPDAPVDSGDKCPDISGRYANAGIEGEEYKAQSKNPEKKATPRFLSGFLFLKAQVDEGKIDFVSIRQVGEDQIALEAWGGGKVLLSEELKRGATGANSNQAGKSPREFFCEGGRVKIALPAMTGSGGGGAAVIGMGSIIDGFALSSGYLVQKREVSAVMVVIPPGFPVPMFGTAWFRYPRVGDALPKDETAPGSSK